MVAFIKLEEDKKWPFNGSLNYNTILQLRLFLQREEIWDEFIYANMFLTLRNHPDWQRDYGINVPPQKPLGFYPQKKNIEVKERGGRK